MFVELLGQHYCRQLRPNRSPSIFAALLAFELSYAAIHQIESNNYALPKQSLKNMFT